MSDIIIPYRYSSSQELEYCLKSIKNIEGNHTVIIVGDEPPVDLLESPVPTFHVPKPHTRTPPHVDSAIKILAGLKSNLIDGDEFILFNDDFFVMQPTRLDYFYDRGTIQDVIASRRRTDSYTRALNNTMDYLKYNGVVRPLCYELHMPMRMNISKAIKHLGTVIEHASYSRVMLFRSLYGNLEGIQSVKVDDVKNVNDYQGMPFLSTNDRTFQQDIGKFIRGALDE